MYTISLLRPRPRLRLRLGLRVDELRGDERVGEGCAAGAVLSWRRNLLRRSAPMPQSTSAPDMVSSELQSSASSVCRRPSSGLRRCDSAAYPAFVPGRSIALAGRASESAARAAR